MDIVRLSVPGTLHYREVVLNVVAAACRAVRPTALGKQKPSREGEPSDFETKLLSAVGEAFNNVAIHAYRGRSAGPVELEIEAVRDGVAIRMGDFGGGFDPTVQGRPNLSTLPESNMGLYIMRSCTDGLTFRRGHPPEEPHVLTLFKRYEEA